MRQQKKPKKKERNYSAWFTGMVLVMVYMILMEHMSGLEEKACRSLLREPIQNISQATLALMQENEWKQEAN